MERRRQRKTDKQEGDSDRHICADTAGGISDSLHNTPPYTDCAIRVAPYFNDCLNTPLIAILKAMYAVDSSENVALVCVPEQRHILVSAHFLPHHV